MERPSEFRISHKGPLTPYRYGDRKWEDYLLDTQTFIHDGAQIQVKAVESLGRQMAEQESNQALQLQGFIAEAVLLGIVLVASWTPSQINWPRGFHLSAIKSTTTVICSKKSSGNSTSSPKALTIHFLRRQMSLCAAANI